MNHFGWTVGSFDVIYLAIATLTTVYYVGRPREPKSRIDVVEILFVFCLNLLAFVGVLSW